MAAFQSQQTLKCMLHRTLKHQNLRTFYGQAHLCGWFMT